MATDSVGGRTRSAGLRLTRRGRAALLVLLLVVSVLVLSLGRAASSQAASVAGGKPATRIVVVEPGESLWSIAGRIAPSVDPRETIERITDLNDLTTSVLPAGKALVVPAPAA